MSKNIESIVPSYVSWKKLTQKMILCYIESGRLNEKYYNKDDVIKFLDSRISEFMAEMVDEGKLRITADWKLQADPKKA